MNKILFIVFAASILWVIPSAVRAADADDIANRDRNKRESLIEQDRLKRERIARKFNDFAERVKKNSPGFKVTLPMSLKAADDIVDQKGESKTKRGKTYTAYAGDNYRLRSKPSDSDKTFTEKVRRGDPLTVVFTERLTDRRKDPTRDWSLVRTRGGAEGYIPLNLLSKKPLMLKKRISRGAGPVRVPDRRHDSSSILHGGFLFEPAVIPRAAGEQSNKFFVDVSSTLYIRSAPGRDTQVLGELRRGEIVEVIEYGAEETIDGITAKWARVQAGGIEGWVFSGYLKRPKIETFDDPAALVPGASFYVKSSLLRVRDEPGDEGTVITSIPHQKQVRITEAMDELQSIGRVQSRWVKIQYDEFSGWVFGGFLSKNRDAYIDDDEIEWQFIFPVDGYYRISSPFGYRVNPIGANKGRQEFHPGIDIAAAMGTPIMAAADGFVILAQEDSSGYGIYVILEHKNGNRSLYGHMSVMKAVLGQKVRTGEVIGQVGSTGRSTGPHLHFEIMINSQYVNPEQYMHAWNAAHGMGDMAAVVVRRSGYEA